MKRIKDLAGQRFGRLEVIEFTGRHTKSRNAIWLCRCDCGNFTEADSGALRVGDKISCGCYTRDRMSKLNRSHGGRKERLYLVWMDMRRRCRDVKNENYKNYGGRGISVCDEWQDYSAFRNWACTHGFDKNAVNKECTLDRIDVNGNYEPSNCRWVGMKVQSNNKRTNKVIYYDGRKQTLKMWAEELGINYSTLTNRLQRGWCFEQAVTEPVHAEHRRKISSAKAV